MLSFLLRVWDVMRKANGFVYHAQHPLNFYIMTNVLGVNGQRAGREPFVYTAEKKRTYLAWYVRLRMNIYWCNLSYVG